MATLQVDAHDRRLRGGASSERTFASARALASFQVGWDNFAVCRLHNIGGSAMADHGADSAALPPRPPERRLARWSKRYPLLAFPFIWVAGVCTFDLALNLALRNIASPRHSLGFYYVLVPLVFSFATAGLLVSFGAWSAATTRGRKFTLIVGLAIECIALPVLHFVALFYLFFAHCAADHACF